MSVGHSFILILLSLFKTQKVFAQSRSLLWSPPCSAVEQQLRRAPYPHYCVGQTATTAIAISSNTITTSIPGKDETTLRLLPSSFTIGLLQLNSSSESCSSSQLRQIFPRAYPVQAPPPVSLHADDLNSNMDTNPTLVEQLFLFLTLQINFF